MDRTFREKITPVLNWILSHCTLPVLAYMKLSFFFQHGDRRLKALKDTHKGGRCFIVGLGPSLTIADLNILHEHKEYTFSMNRCYRMFASTEWRPDCYLVSDAKACTSETRTAMKKMMEAGSLVVYSKLEIKGMDRDAVFFKADFTDFVLRNSRKEKYRRKGHFCRMSTDAYSYIYAGSTSVHSIIQLAYYMGFKEVYLVGTDCGTVDGKTYSDALSAKDNKAYVIGEGNLMIRDYESMRKDIEAKSLDFHIYNATRGGYLEVFPRVKLEDVIADGQSGSYLERK